MFKQFAFLAVAIGVSLAASTALAQRDAGSKIRGDAYSTNAASTYGSHAYDHARILNQYSATGQPVPKEVIKEHTDAVRSNVAAAKKAYSKLSDAAKKDAAKQLAAIEEHHAKVLEMCKMLDAECAKDEGDSATVCACCNDMEKELKAAAEDHAKLHKQLKLNAPVSAKK
jgi:hypothetical protein